MLLRVLHIHEGWVWIYLCRHQAGELGSAVGGAGVHCLGSGSFIVTIIG